MFRIERPLMSEDLIMPNEMVLVQLDPSNPKYYDKK